MFRQSLGTGRTAKKSLTLTVLILAAFAGLPAAANGYVYWADSGANTIFRATLDGSWGWDLGIEQPTSVAVDAEYIYWTSNTGTIGRVTLGADDLNGSFITDGTGMHGVAVDAQHIYWTSGDGPLFVHGTIARANLDGSGVDRNFIENAGGPWGPPVEGVAVDAQHIYWTSEGTIGRANLAGSGVEPSFISGASIPKGVVVNAQHIYWTNYETGTIGRANLDGSGVNQSFISGASTPKGVVVDAQHIYWTNYEAGTIGRANLDGSGVTQSFISGATPHPMGLAVDNLAPPETTIDSGPSELTNDSTPSFSFSSSKPGALFQCRIDSGSLSYCASPKTLSMLADGPHTFRVQAIDSANTADPTPASLSFTVDTAAPQTQIDSGPSGSTNDSTPTFNFSSTEANSTFECKLDNGSFAACTSPQELGPLADGPHTFRCQAIDSANTADPTPASLSFTVDTAAPQTQIDSGPSGSTNDSTPTFNFSSTEANSTFECKLDNGSFAACTSPQELGPLADGPHTFRVQAIDSANTADPTPASLSFTVDTAAPQTQIDSGPSGSTNDSTPTFNFSSTEANSTFECKLDNGSFAACTSPQELGPLADGPHTFRVQAIDSANTADPTPASLSFTVDTAAPQTQIDSGPSGSTNDSTPTFNFSSTEANSTFECKLDNGSFAACTSPQELGPLADGPHTFEAKATDAAANTDATPAPRSFTVDTAAPLVVTPAPLVVTPAPLVVTPAPPSECVVPNLRGKKLEVAKKRVRKADCKIGKVKKVKRATASTGKVVQQKPKAGTTVPAGTTVAVTLR